MIKSISNCLAMSLLLIGMPTPTKATDNRETGLIVIGAATAVAGLYVMCRETDKDAKRSLIRNFSENLAGALLVVLGAAGMLASEQVIKVVDKEIFGKKTILEEISDVL